MVAMIKRGVRKLREARARWLAYSMFVEREREREDPDKGVISKDAEEEGGRRRGGCVCVQGLTGPPPHKRREGEEEGSFFLLAEKGVLPQVSGTPPPHIAPHTV